MLLKIPYLILALFPIGTMAAPIPTKHGAEIEETSKKESPPWKKESIAKRERNDANSTNVSTQVSNPIEAKNDTVNAKDKDASLKNVLKNVLKRFEKRFETREEEEKSCEWWHGQCGWPICPEGAIVETKPGDCCQSCSGLVNLGGQDGASLPENGGYVGGFGGIGDLGVQDGDSLPGNGGYGYLNLGVQDGVKDGDSLPGNGGYGYLDLGVQDGVQYGDSLPGNGGFGMGMGGGYGGEGNLGVQHDDYLPVKTPGASLPGNGGFGGGLGWAGYGMGQGNQNYDNVQSNIGTRNSPDGWTTEVTENNEQGTIVDIDTSRHGAPLLRYNVEEYQPPAIPDYVEAGETESEHEEGDYAGSDEYGETESEHEGSNINSGININIKINNPTSGFGGEGNLGYDSQNGGMGVRGVHYFGGGYRGGYGHRPSWAEIRREYVTDSQNGGGEQVDADENQDGGDYGWMDGGDYGDENEVGEEQIDGDENEDGDEQVDGDENEDGEEQIDGDENQDE